MGFENPSHTSLHQIEVPGVLFLKDAKPAGLTIYGT